MPDDRDRPSKRHTDWTATPVDSTPRARSQSGVIDCPEAAARAAGNEVRDTMAVDLANTEAWQALEARVAATEKSARDSAGKWRWAKRALIAVLGLSTSVLGYAVTRIDSGGYNRRVTEEYRQAVDRHNEEIRELRDRVLDLRGQIRALNPVRAVPLQGPRTEPDRGDP